MVLPDILLVVELSADMLESLTELEMSASKPFSCVIAAGYVFSLISMSTLQPARVLAGPYQESAHGDVGSGVNRTTINGYCRGNCSHCHEQHASVDGQEPGPVAGSAAGFALFSENFNDNVQSPPYSQADNFCFYCHISTGGLQSGGGVTNTPYVNTFAGYPTAAASGIFEAFNLNSSHNLYDVKMFAASTFDFFSQDSNPCVACHNPHLAKRNRQDPTDPSLTAISRPTAHDELWGDDPGERMDNYNYRAPYYYGSTTTFEPGGTAVSDGSLTPDYNAFCLDCHQYEVPISIPGLDSVNPNTTDGYLSAINWSTTGDMHGQRARVNDIDGLPKNFGTVTAPYNTAPVQSNYTLSCIDCHEPHGTVLTSAARTSSFLLRKEVNNNEVSGCGSGTDDFCETEFCASCHTFSHCGGPQGCLACHYHGAANINCGGPWTGPNF